MRFKVEYLRQKWVKDEKIVDANNFDEAAKCVGTKAKVISIEAERDNGQLEFPFQILNPQFANHLGTLAD